MCVVSMVTDHYLTKPNWDRVSQGQMMFNISQITRQEFDDLKKEVLELKELIKKAKIYDDANNQPHCENAEKIEMVKKIADLVGIDMKDVVEALR